MEQRHARGALVAFGWVRRRRHHPGSATPPRVRLGQGIAAPDQRAPDTVPSARRRHGSLIALRARTQKRRRGSGKTRSWYPARGGGSCVGAGWIRGRSAAPWRSAPCPRAHRKLPPLSPRSEAVDTRRQSTRAGGRGRAAVDVRADHVRAHAALPSRAPRGDGSAVPLPVAAAAAAGAAADRRQEDHLAAAPRARRSFAESQRRRRRRTGGDHVARAHGAPRIPQAKRQLVQAVRSLPRRSRRARRLAPSQGKRRGTFFESIRVASVSAGERNVRRRSLDGRDVPAWPYREDSGPPDRASLRSHRGRLAPEEMFPAGEANITVRRITLSGGLTLRVAESGPLSGAPLLLVHGWSANIYTFAEMMPALANAGYRVAALDLPGFGLSDKPTDDSFYTTRAQCDAVVEAADKIGFRDYTYV